MNTRDNFKTVLWIGFGLLLVALVVLSRVGMTDIPNFKPVAAIALFAGFLFSNRGWALLIVGSGMLLSDFLIGTYSIAIAAFVYIGLLLPVFLGWRLQGSDKLGGKFWGKTLCASLFASVFFFLISNWAVWQFSGFYPLTMTGLWECFVYAVPFFRNTLAGDLMFTIVLFGSYALIYNWKRRPAIESSEALA